MRILVPVDFSDCSVEVTRLAGRMAQAFEAELVLLHAVELPPGISPEAVVQPDPEVPPMAARDYVTRDTSRHLPVYERLTEVEGLEVTTRIEHGQAADAILRVAEELDVDHIVMGTHGRRGFARMMTGSVAEDVLRRTLRPVTVLRTEHKPKCEARSCAWCTSGTLESRERLWAELDG